MTIHILTTGGTIDKVYHDALSAFEVGAPQIGEVLHRSAVTFEWKVTTLMKKDSLDLTDADRDRIVEAVAASPWRHVLVTHGTDTMVDTARRLQAIPDKVVVLTGSMQPARFHESDAIFNIGYAVAAVQILPPGVYIAMNGRVFLGDHCRKNRSEGRFDEA